MTSAGAMSFSQLAELQRKAGPGSRIWFNTARGRESWINRMFAGMQPPCVQALRTFESALLDAMARDVADAQVEVRQADPGDDDFLTFVLGSSRPEPLDEPWQKYFAAYQCVAETGEWRGDEPVLAFLNEKLETRRDFEGIKDQGKLPAAFARMIDKHLGKADGERHRLLLNRRHDLVRDALAAGIHGPQASLLRTFVYHAFVAAGLVPRAAVQDALRDDLDWIAETLKSKGGKA
jgi:hypothetical protein